MADKTPFVINDRRKFTAEGELRHDLETTPEEKPKAAGPERSEDEPASTPQHASAPIEFPSKAESDRSEDEPAKASASSPIEFPSSASEAPEETSAEQEDGLPPVPSAEQSERAGRAYDATVDRLDTAIRATNPGMERMPEMDFERFVQSLYMQAILQLGGAAEPGQTPQVDLLGARQSIDMLGVLAEKTKGNLTGAEDKLLQSALFEARMGFLEITQALARQAAAKQPGTAPGAPGGGAGGPRVVR